MLLAPPFVYVYYTFIRVWVMITPAVGVAPSRRSRTCGTRVSTAWRTCFLPEGSLEIDAKQRPFASIDAMRHQVARVLDHQSFSRSRGPARLLKHLADRLAFNGGLPVTQTELAKVLGLPRDFDPSRNPLVRMHMSKLRRMLSRYAAGDGRNDEVVLELPRNSYQLRAHASPTPAAAVGEGSLNGNVAAAASSRSLVLVSEFVSPAEPTLGAALARSLASLLVAELLDSPHLAAIGPLYRSRLAADKASVAETAQRLSVQLYLDGEITCGGRGLQLCLQLVHAETGATHWTDWLDDPTSLADDSIDLTAKLLAVRIAERLRRCPALDPSGLAVGTNA